VGLKFLVVRGRGQWREGGGWFSNSFYNWGNNTKMESLKRLIRKKGYMKH